MLVLTRRSGESILVGNDITVEVQKVSKNRVRLLIQAPPHVRILRQEIAGRADVEADASSDSAAEPVEMLVGS